MLKKINNHYNDAYEDINIVNNTDIKKLNFGEIKC